MKLRKNPAACNYSLPRLLDLVKPDYVHAMIDGKIVQSGGLDMALKLEKGYDWLEAI